MAPSVPIIDMSDFEARRDEVTAQLMEAAENIGFFQVVNHGIPQELVDSMFGASAGRAFPLMPAKLFALPTEVKARYPLDPAKNIGWEWQSQVRPSTGFPDQKESIQLGMVGMDGLWPSRQDAPGFQDTAEAFMAHCHRVSWQLLGSFATGLGLEADFFNKHHDPSKDDCSLTLRCLHYPPVDNSKIPANYWRAGSHTDFDTLTLLFQREGQGGLEVCPGREASTDFGVGNDWTPVVPRNDAITINIGDLLMRWSDDRLKSNFHRVAMPPRDEPSASRYSIAFFNNANKDSVVQGPKGKYPAIKAGDYVKQAFKPQFDAKQAWLAAQKLGGTDAPTAIKVFTSQAANLAQPTPVA